MFLLPSICLLLFSCVPLTIMAMPLDALRSSKESGDSLKSSNCPDCSQIVCRSGQREQLLASSQWFTSSARLLCLDMKGLDEMESIES